MNGSKRARNASSIVNQTNTCGGVGKSGLPPSIGRRGREGAVHARAIPRAVQYACPASPGLYAPSLNAVNDGLVPGGLRNSNLLFTSHIPPSVQNIFFMPVNSNHLSGGVGRSRHAVGRFRLTF